MWFSLEAAAAAAAGAVRPVLLARIDAEPIVRAWSGVGDLFLAADAIETTDQAKYLGIGLFNDWPAFEALINGAAGRVTLTLSGVDALAQDLAEAGLDQVENQPVHFGVLFLDEALQPIGDPLWLLEGVMETVETDRDSGRRSVAANIGYGPLDRRRPVLAYWSPADQAARAEGDRFCERTPLYSEGVEVTWPRWN